MTFIETKSGDTPLWIGVTEREERHVWRTLRENTDVSHLIKWREGWGQNDYRASLYLSSNVHLDRPEWGFGAEFSGIGLKAFVCQTIL